MPLTVSSKLELKITDVDVDSNGNGTLSERFVVNEEWTDGTSNTRQADLCYISKAATASSTPTDVDLAGALTRRVHGSTLTAVDLCGIYLRNKSATTTLRIGGDAASVPLFGAVGDFINIPPGTTFLWESALGGVTVTASTGDILQIDTASGTAEYDLAVWGRSA
jgi:hypothetical protein